MRVVRTYTELEKEKAILDSIAYGVMASVRINGIPKSTLLTWLREAGSPKRKLLKDFTCEICGKYQGYSHIGEKIACQRCYDKARKRAADKETPHLENKQTLPEDIKTMKRLRDYLCEFAYSNDPVRKVYDPYNCEKCEMLECCGYGKRGLELWREEERKTIHAR